MKEDTSISRRRFLKKAAAIGAAFAATPVISKVTAAENVLDGNPTRPDGMKYRTLGTGKAAMKVSAIGFGCMGLNYNRSQSPDRKECIRIIHEAVDRGVTLFDTALVVK